jgi:hypothetical protein
MYYNASEKETLSCYNTLNPERSRQNAFDVSLLNPKACFFRRVTSPKYLKRVFLLQQYISPHDNALMYKTFVAARSLLTTRLTVNDVTAAVCGMQIPVRKLNIFSMDFIVTLT